METKQVIQSGLATLGIEFGSTRIKAVLIDDRFQAIASGSFEWENQLVDGVWTYDLDSVWHGLQEAYRNLRQEVSAKYDAELHQLSGIGISAMMHGYLAFDQADHLLVPFRTWRNALTEEAAQALSALFHFNIPQRWSIAHLYQAMLNNEAHVAQIDFLTTLAGYVHWQLTGKKVLGVGDASGMFPIDDKLADYDQHKLAQFNDLPARKNYPWQLQDILPEALVAGADAGVLTEKGARLLDPSGHLEAGIPLCPPEGDAGTGMVATNSVAARTGNISAGTSAFAMIVLEKQLANVYPKIDLVTTPSGAPVAMVHINNCTSEINAWMKLFAEFASLMGMEIKLEELFLKLFNAAIQGDADCGGLLSYGYYSGENITHIAEGRPLLVRAPESRFNLANFMRLHLFSAFGALKIGMDILKKEHVAVDSIVAHGGIFKTPVVAQKILAAVIDTPVSTLENAGEGGAWGIALLAAYRTHKQADETLASYLKRDVFAGSGGCEILPDERDVEGFATYMQRYIAGLPIERMAADKLI